MKIRFVLVALAAHVRAASRVPEAPDALDALDAPDALEAFDTLDAFDAHPRREVALWNKVTRDAALLQH
jgi:hypothetical protein